jgi:ribonuclease P protein component
MSGPSATPNSSVSPGRNAARVHGARFPKSSRLLKRADFRRVYDEGKKLPSASFSAICLRRQGDGSQEGSPRVGLTVPRALGNAVQRNRLRRRMREAIRRELWRLEGPLDLVFHPRRSAGSTPLPMLRREVERILAKCGTLS